ncbi:Dentin sialophosphoprotein [Saliniradius amylolyticus]|uniref:Dentin sialophosphoprotein n=1 Tax=Saliniradius amylolyticus TaxID=2183582 RepID=A0A2S2DZZ1_9ALTE|nr:ImpA family metalloprotease [Saliniradius amylolyticus]AWL10975.1 Dentin sialophosphoprotein [Saliniradius amylolyticus]
MFRKNLIPLFVTAAFSGPGLAQVAEVTVSGTDGFNISQTTTVTAVQQFEYALWGNGELYLKSLTWDPGKYSIYFDTDVGNNIPFLMSNNNDESVPLALAGVGENAPFLAMGGNPLSDDGRNDATASDTLMTMMRNGVTWLLSGTPPENLDHVVLAHLSRTDYTYSVEWLQDLNADMSVNERSACNGSALADCLADDAVQLLILSNSGGDDVAESVRAILAQARAQGMPVLYMHNSWDHQDLSKAVFEELGIVGGSMNYFTEHKVVDYPVSELNAQISEQYTNIEAQVQDLGESVWLSFLSNCSSEDWCSNLDVFNWSGSGETDWSLTFDSGESSWSADSGMSGDPAENDSDSSNDQVVGDSGVTDEQATDDGAVSDEQATDDGAVSDEQTTDDGVVSDEQATDDGAVSDEQATDDGVVSDEQATDDGVVSDEQATDDGVVSDEQATDDGVVSDEQATDDGVVSDEQATDDGVVSDEQATDDGVVSDEQATDDGVVSDEPTDTDAEMSEDPANSDSNESSPLERALATGSIEGLSGPAQVTEALEDLQRETSATAQQIEEALLSKGNLSLADLTWDPGRQSIYFNSVAGNATPILISNNKADSVALALAGLDTSAPFLAMAGNPLADDAENDATVSDTMLTVMRNSLEWLTGEPPEAINNVVFSHVGYNDRVYTEDWLQSLNPDVTINARTACNGEALAECLADDAVQLLILSNSYGENGIIADSVRPALAQARAQGIPVLYMHRSWYHRELSQAIFNELGIVFGSSNYFSEYKVQNYRISDLRGDISDERTSFSALIQHLEDGAWSFDLSNCDSEDWCSNVAGLESDFLSVATQIQSGLKYYDRMGVRLFEETDYRLDKLLVLLADLYRQEVNYPMYHTSGEDTAYIRALFADMAQYQSRNAAVAPPDLGAFSRTDFSHITPVDRTITLTSQEPFLAAGVYALPGVPVTVTRTDTNAVTTGVFVNTQRDAATQIWKKGFDRPRFLRGETLPLVPGESVTFVSVYGGPIQIDFDTKEVDVTVEFEQVGEHPYWNGPEDDNTFDMALSDGAFDWAELSTPGFEVHSQLEKMRETVSASEFWSSASEIANATQTYISNYPHIVAGLQGDGIDTVGEIHDFANARGLTVETLSMAKHMNADRATCGAGCSGNPYDANWAFGPTKHGDLHELGHGLESDRFRFHTENGSIWELHATTNIYSYYSKSRYAAEYGTDSECQSLPFEELYEQLSSAAQEADPKQAMSKNNLTHWDLGVTTYVQFIMAAENSGALDNGWHLWGRLHILERNFSAALNSVTAWSKARDGLGFGSFTLTEAKALSNNDWMLIALSNAAERDYRALFDLYGLSYSSAAENQLDLAGFVSLPAVFYAANDSNFCYGLDKPALDPASDSWPHSE